MQKTVWTFGLISGVVLAVFLLATMPFTDLLTQHNLGEVVGYATMVLAFLLVYFGVRFYRDNVLGGTIGFGRALGVGMLIVAVAACCYVATWELIYFKLRPDFAEKFSQVAIDKAQVPGARPEVQAQKTKEARDFVTMYNKPLMNAAFTFLEPLPPGVVLALISAGLLRRKRRDEDTTVARPVTVV